MTDCWESVSGHIRQAASVWSSNAPLRDIALRTIVASHFDPSEAGALRAELEGLVGSLGAPLLSSLEIFLAVLAACSIPRGETIGVLPPVPALYVRKVR